METPEIAAGHKTRKDTRDSVDAGVATVVVTGLVGVRTGVRSGVQTGVGGSADIGIRIRIRVRSSTGTYEVLYGAGIVGRLSSLLSGLMQNASGGAHSLSANTGVFLLSSPRVARHWQKEVARGIGARNLRASDLLRRSRSAENIATVERICRQLVRAGADRRAVLVAVGGGVVGDVCGIRRGQLSCAECGWCMCPPRWLRRSIAPSAEKRA